MALIGVYRGRGDDEDEDGIAAKIRMQAGEFLKSQEF
jgi:hypothetical protein